MYTYTLTWVQARYSCFISELNFYLHLCYMHKFTGQMAEWWCVCVNEMEILGGFHVTDFTHSRNCYEYGDF